MTGTETICCPICQGSLKKYDRRIRKAIDNNAENSSNCSSFSKIVRSDHSEIEIEVPRDRKGQHNPQIVPKYQRDISGLDGQIISMYSNGMRIRDISEHIESLYGASVSAETISKITDNVNF